MCKGTKNSRAEKDTPFLRRRLHFSVPGGFGSPFPRRRLLFQILRVKRYPIPAQNGTSEHSGRVWHHFPAQAVTFSTEVITFGLPN
jgi:hypothetical protein